MANTIHAQVLREALNNENVDLWNNWRKSNPRVHPNLEDLDLRGAQLYGADLSNTSLKRSNLSNAQLGSIVFQTVDPKSNLTTNLSGANLSEAILISTDLSGANLTRTRFSHRTILWNTNLSFTNLSGLSLRNIRFDGANFLNAKLTQTNLSGASLTRSYFHSVDLSKTNIKGADFSYAYLADTDLSGLDLRGTVFNKTSLAGANLSKVDLRKSDLRNADLSGANLSDANISQSIIFGVNAWRTNLNNTVQRDLVINDGESEITVDNLKVAQFVYLILYNPEIREAINTLSNKVVLILGRFTAERKAILDAIREELRNQGYLPVLFDFEKPDSRDITETIVTLAHLAYFIIADISDPRSVPQELQAIIPNLPSVPVQPLIVANEEVYGMFEHFKNYPWVLPLFRYNNTQHLIASLAKKVIEPAETKVFEIRSK